MIDTHAHLDDPRFAADLPDVLARATALGVARIFCIGVDLATSQAAVALAQQHPHILSAVVGIQPNYVAEVGLTDFDTIVALSTSPGVVGIGETGLDRYWDKAPFALQEDYFAKHLALARQVNKPVVIHCREAEPDVVRMLLVEFEAHGPIRGVMHSFSGDAATATACLDLGFHLSFAGMVTYKNADALRAVAKLVPRDRILVETDSPYLAPVPMRGKRNEPAFVAHTVSCLAAVRGESIAEVAAATAANARTLFGV